MKRALWVGLRAGPNHRSSYQLRVEKSVLLHALAGSGFVVVDQARSERMMLLGLRSGEMLQRKDLVGE